ncbi:deoxyribonuclease-4 [Alkalicoccobacillus murimartini]|uniref:Probable endonuclease 4 n=2 Tax=Alkalicoccobacillus murimartini TaxID=171685 RepID=A0ABT9YKE7_9BACI|nr:deoxyribonuclease-4 [Alkalicoccobacillus murimartini]
MKGKEMLLGASKETISNGANTMMVYTGSPQNSRRKPIEEFRVNEATALLETKDIKPDDVVVHAPYILNLANTSNKELFSYSIEFLHAELSRTQTIGARQLILHPGSHVGAGYDAGIQNIVSGLNEVLHERNNVQICLEVMAGKGTECGRTFEELARMIEGVHNNSRLSVCLDTCHLHDGGYNVKDDFDDVLNNFDKVIGFDKLKVIHLNDSKNEKGSRKDRHENIGFGLIGFKSLHYVASHKQLKDIPKILETPFVNGKPLDKKEIAMLRKGVFNPKLVELSL